MRSRERLLKLKEWAKINLCQNIMKSPGKKFDITDIEWKTPEVYLAWAPTRNEGIQTVIQEASNVAPCIIIMPDNAYAKYQEEQRFDRYSNIHRPKELGQHFAVSILFVVYEPGIRLPGFYESSTEKNGEGMDMTLLKEGTEEGLFTLIDWMDDCTETLLRDQIISGTDLSLEETELRYGLYKDQEYVVDRRPIYYGFVNARFNCYANAGVNEEVKSIIN